jgi:uncharacterized membrane protein YfcA
MARYDAVSYKLRATMVLMMLIGLVAGVLSGLLGIGGGLVLVPGLLVLQSLSGSDATAVALATSLATIAFTGSWSAYQQHRLGNVDIDKVKKLSAGVAVGAVLGGYTAALMPGTVLKIVFCVFAFYVAGQMWLGAQPRMDIEFNTRSAAGAGLATGALSSWVGIGGGTIVVPFLTSTGEPVKKAIGISSAVGVPVAVFASLGFAWSAWRSGVSVPGRWGFVDLTALVGIVPASLLGSYGGVRLGNRVRAPVLKKIFAVILSLSAAKILFSL